MLLFTPTVYTMFMISTNVSDSETLSLKLHYVAVHKAPKYGAKVPTNANTPYRISFAEIIWIDFVVGCEQ
jgi:hypothetical protein